MKGRWGRKSSWNSMGGPNIIRKGVAGLVDLPEKKLLVTLCVQHHIERAGDCPFQFGVKARLRVGGKPIEENSQSKHRIELGHRSVPLPSNGGIHLGRK